MKQFLINIETLEDDFSFIDLDEAIRDGIKNIGNFTLKKLEVKVKK